MVVLNVVVFISETGIRNNCGKYGREAYDFRGSVDKILDRDGGQLLRGWWFQLVRFVQYVVKSN